MASKLEQLIGPAALASVARSQHGAAGRQRSEVAARDPFRGERRRVDGERVQRAQQRGRALDVARLARVRGAPAARTGAMVGEQDPDRLVDRNDVRREARRGGRAHHARLRREIEQRIGAGRGQAQHPPSAIRGDEEAALPHAAVERLQRRPAHDVRAEHALKRGAHGGVARSARQAAGASCARQSPRQADDDEH